MVQLIRPAVVHGFYFFTNTVQLSAATSTDNSTRRRPLFTLTLLCDADTTGEVDRIIFRVAIYAFFVITKAPF